MPFEFPLAHADQQTFINDLDAQLDELEAISNGFLYESVLEPTQGEWEAAWEAAGFTLPIPPGQELIWWDGTRPRGLYMVLNNDFFTVVNMFRIYPTSVSVFVEQFYLAKYVVWADDWRMVAVGRVYDQDHLRGFGSDMIFYLHADGSLMPIAPSFHVGPNQNKLGVRNGAVYADEDNIWLASAARSIRQITLTANMPTERSVIITGEIGYTMLTGTDGELHFKTFNNGAVNWNSIDVEVYRMNAGVATLEDTFNIAVAASQGVVNHSFNFTLSGGADSLRVRFNILGTPVTTNVGLCIFDPFLFTDDDNGWTHLIREDFRILGPSTTTGLTLGTISGAALVRVNRTTLVQDAVWDIPDSGESLEWTAFDAVNEIAYGYSNDTSNVYAFTYSTGLTTFAFTAASDLIALRYYNGFLYFKRVGNNNIFRCTTAGASITALFDTGNQNPFVITSDGIIHDSQSGYKWDIALAERSLMDYEEDYIRRLKAEFADLVVPEGGDRVEMNDSVMYSWYSRVMKDTSILQAMAFNPSNDAILFKHQDAFGVLAFGAGFSVASRVSTRKVWRLQAYSDHIPDWKLLGKAVYSASISEYTFNVDGLLGDDREDYDHLMLVACLNRTVLGDGLIFVQVNADTTIANYVTTYHTGISTTETFATQYQTVAGIQLIHNVHVRMQPTMMLFSDINNLNTHKQAIFIEGTSASYTTALFRTTVGVGSYMVAGRINSLRIVPSANALLAYSELRLFAIRGKRRTHRSQAYGYHMA